VGEIRSRFQRLGVVSPPCQIFARQRMPKCGLGAQVLPRLYFLVCFLSCFFKAMRILVLKK